MTTKVIFIGANTKATDRQCKSVEHIGEVLSRHDYYCIHGGGEGTMLAITVGMKMVIPDGSNCHIITPRHMIPENTDIYNLVDKRVIVDTIHTRIGMLLEHSKDCKYVIVYAGGIGTIHELMSILVCWYTEPENMPDILICNEDANDWCDLLAGLLSPLCIAERPYMLVMRNKIFKLTTKHLEEMLITGLSNFPKLLK